MNHHAYQWRPIRGRRFHPWRLVGTLLLIGAGAFGVLFWWAVVAVVVSLAAGLPR